MSHWLVLALALSITACSYGESNNESAPLVVQEAVAKKQTVADSSQSILVQNVALRADSQGKLDSVDSIKTRAASAQRVSLATNLGPANMCEGAITHADRVNIPPVAKPPFAKYYKDPAFGSRVVRITDSKFGEVNKPAYSTMQAWNADESLMLLYRGGQGNGFHVLHDGHTYEPIKEFDFIPADLEEVFWSHTDPDVFYYVSKYSRDLGHFKKYSVRAGKAEKIADFGNYCGLTGVPTGGGDIHMQSMDDDKFGFRCRKDDGSFVMFNYSLSTGETNVQDMGKGTKWENWTAPTAAPSGNRYIHQGYVLSSDLKTVEHKLDMYKAYEHSNTGLTHNGQDAMYQVVFNPSPKGCDGDLWQGVGHLVEHNMETGACRSIINEAQGYPYTTSGTHASARAYLRPGWVAMSSIGREKQFEYFSNKRKAPALLSEVYLANTDPDNSVTCRLAHHRSFGKMAKQGDYPAYFGEPHATISPSGTRIVFGSDWYDSGSVDSYVIELPGYQKPQ